MNSCASACFAASTISNLGDGIGVIAYPWLATALTRDPLLIALVAMLAAHALILAVGSILLAARVGFVAAWFNGVAPFLIGGLIKSVIAAVCVAVASRWTDPRVWTA